MSNEVQVLIKINNFGKGDINSFKKHMYNELSLIHMHQVNNFRIDATAKDFDIDALIDYTANNESDITLIYFDTAMGYAKKCEIKYGLLASKKSILFGMDLEAKVVEENTDTEDGFFYALCNLINENSDEESTLPTVGDTIKINTLICSDIDVLDWYEQKENKTLTVNHIDYVAGNVFVDNCEFGLNINEVIKS